MNFVYIMTDSQSKSMVGAYGDPQVDTPNLDNLANTGIRFERAYTACPVCTPARGAIFSGQHPQNNGAVSNGQGCSVNLPLMGTIFNAHGYKTGYTGKWHLDSAGYFGGGDAQGGFPQQWWYDGKVYGDELGPDMFYKFLASRTADDLRKAGFTEDKIWGHRVADRAVDFLENAGNEPFVLAVSFDEPHAPYVAPPEYWEKFSKDELPTPPNFNASVENKPAIQQLAKKENADVMQHWDDVLQQKFYGCNSYIDREIGRVIDAVDKLHGDDTVIIYTTDHGDMGGVHGQFFKGPFMYENTCNIPFIVRMPGGPSGAVSHSLISHLDILPTMMELAGMEIPSRMHGVSMTPVLNDPNAQIRDSVLINWHRFSSQIDKCGHYYPIRCLVEGRYKLVINLYQTDEFYDLEKDPLELNNLINDPDSADARNNLHERLIAEMDRINDPMRSIYWANRPWHKTREEYFGPSNVATPETWV